MRKTLAFVSAVVLTAALLVGSESPAGAASVTGVEFAADCNDDGLVALTADLRVKGDPGTIERHCVVDVADGVKLTFRGVTLDGTSACSGTCGLIVASDGPGVTLKAVDSEITMSGPVQLAAGSGGEFPEPNGTVKVVNSEITGSDVNLEASKLDSGGRIVVGGSQLTSTGSGLVNAVQMRTGDAASTTVKNSAIDSAGDIVISSGLAAGPATTKVKRSDLLVPGGSTVTITANGLGACTSSGNTPAVACS